jgi:hypothetical protein
MENVQSFVFAYKDSAGTAITSPVNQSKIRQINITITGRTAKPNKLYQANNGYRTYTLSSLVIPRNLAF